MPSIGQIRGAVLEEAVAFLLRDVGYKLVTKNDFGARPGHSGLELQGRGGYHQIDSVAEMEQGPAFMYALRLLVEAKCYSGKDGTVCADNDEYYYSMK